MYLADEVKMYGEGERVRLSRRERERETDIEEVQCLRNSSSLRYRPGRSLQSRCCHGDARVNLTLWWPIGVVSTGRSLALDFARLARAKRRTSDQTEERA